MAARTQRILAMGGVQLYPGSTDWPLHQFMLDLTGRERPRICMLGTASGEDASGLASFYATFARHAEATHLDLFGRTVDDVEAFLSSRTSSTSAAGTRRTCSRSGGSTASTRR